MTTLQETMIELADCHTTLYYLEGDQPDPAPLPFGTAEKAEKYVELYKRVADLKRVSFDDVRSTPGVILDKLSPTFHKNKYWSIFFASSQQRAYALNAWKFVLPIWCSLKTRIDFIAPPEFNFAVRPVPRVVLYPFGWSSWLSLRIVGPHTLKQLAEFNQHLFAAKCFRLNPDPAPLEDQPSAYSVRDFFDHVAEGVSADAFGGINTATFGPHEPVTVTTVMAKKGGRPALGGLLGDEEKMLLRITRPDGPASGGEIEKQVHRLEKESNTKYVLMEKYGRFIWMEDRLKPDGKNRAHLRCYHNNTFNSLLHARHLYQLLVQAATLGKLSAGLLDLTRRVSLYLSSPSPYYENASLREFLRDPAVTDAKQKIAELSKSSGPQSAA